MMMMVDCRLSIADCRTKASRLGAMATLARPCGTLSTCSRKRERGTLKACYRKAVLFLFALLLVPSAAWGQAYQPPKFVGLRVGIANQYKAGLWTQVELTLLGGSEMLTGSVSVIVPDGDGVPGRVSTPPSKPCEVLPGQPRVVRLVTRFGRADDLVAEFRVDGKVVAKRAFRAGMQADGESFGDPLEQQKLIVSVGESPLSVVGEAKPQRLEDEAKPVIAHVTDIEELPMHWYAYEGVHAIILSTGRPEMYRKLASNNARVQALDQWVRMGGKLILCVGSQGDEILAENQPLRQFVPGRFVGGASLGQTGAIETYVGSHSSIAQAVKGKPKLRISRLAGVRGVVEVDEGGTPLVIRTARGFGQVVFVAVDLDQWPLSKWPDRPRLLARLLDLPGSGSEESAENAAMMHYGYRDLAGQLRSGLDQFSGIKIVPFWLVAGLIFGYILLIGPADYFFLRKVVRRMEWTWVTFPAIVILVCLGAYVMAYQFKGSQIRVNQIDLVDVDAASGQMRGATWMNVFSPRMESFDFTVKPQGTNGHPAPDSQVLMAWLGLPGNGLGGMNSRASGGGLWPEEFRYANNLRAMDGVPIQVWSTKSLTARWNAGSATCPEADLIESDRILTGSITNTLPFALQDCTVLYGESAYELGTIAPNQAKRLGASVKQTGIKTFLTKVLGERDGGRQAGSPYNQWNADPSYTLETMMFYQAAGGRHYARLYNSYQEFVDLSGLLKTGRAILFTKKPAPAAAGHFGATLFDGDKPLGGEQDRHETIYRFLFPVKTEQPAAK